MKERRKRPRKNTPYLSKVIDVASDATLGRLVDITADGLMYLASQRARKHHKFTLRLTLPAPIRGRCALEIDCVVVWCRPDSNPDFFRVGVRFQNIGGDDASLIESVMHSFKLVD